jgi:N-carbamoylputrescine amidase
MVAAAAAMRSVVGDKEGNLARVDALAGQAVEAGAELLVLPEACLTGYTVRQSLRPWAESVPGPLTDAVAEIAGRRKLAILAGLAECGSGPACHLTQALIDPDGLQAVYRKTHLGPTEKKHFRSGDRIAVFDYQNVRYGLQLCYEGHFPEISLAQALAGAEVILLPHASPRETPGQKQERWLRYLPARAYDNTVFVVACNQVGDNGGGLTFAGAAMIISPKGEVLAQAAGESQFIVAARLKAQDLTAVKTGRMGYFLPLRRPDLYKL